MPSIDTLGSTVKHTYNTTSPVTLSPSSQSSRWSELIPPQTALTFAVIWDPDDDLVAFSGAQLLNAPEAEDTKLSPSEVLDGHSYSQILTIDPSSTNLESENTAIVAFFRDNHSFLFSSQVNTPILDKLQFNACRTQTSSTLDGLDVYLRGSLMERAHHRHQRYSCLENLAADFHFDPRTSFAKVWKDCVRAETELMTDEGFFEMEGQGSSIQSNERYDAFVAECPSKQRPPFVTVHIYDTDGKSSTWSTVEVPDAAPLSGLLYGDQERPRLTRRLRKRRPTEVPAPPLEVLRRMQYNYDIPPPPSSPTLPCRPKVNAPRLSTAIPKLVGRFKRLKRSSDAWVWIEITQEITQYEL